MLVKVLTGWIWVPCWQEWLWALSACTSTRQWLPWEPCRPRLLTTTTGQPGGVHYRSNSQSCGRNAPLLWSPDTAFPVGWKTTGQKRMSENWEWMPSSTSDHVLLRSPEPHNWISGPVIYWSGPNHQHRPAISPRSCSRCIAWEQSGRWWGLDPRHNCGNDWPSRRRRRGQHTSPNQLTWSPNY